MSDVLPYLPGLAPYAGAALIVLSILGFLIRSFTTGSLLTRAQADELLRAERNVAEIRRETWEAERDARTRDAESLAEMVEIGRVVADGLDALRKLAERGEE